MVDYHVQQIDSVFHALGDATRRQMLLQLAGGSSTVGQLAKPHSMSLAAASKHIKVLEAAGLIRREIRGRVHHCQLEPGPLAKAHEWLSVYEQFWTSRLDRLEDLLLRQEKRTSASPQGDDT
jgi:DNA-binding transcriptional ArsR family regulator